LLQLLLLISGVILALGVIVLLNNYKKLENISFFLFVIPVCGWLVTNYFADNSNQLYWNLNFTKMAMFFGISIAFFLLLFTLFFIKNKQNKVNKFWIIALATPYVIVSLISLVGSTVISSVQKIGGIAEISFGVLSSVYFVVFLGFILASAYRLISGYFKSRGSDKQRIAFVMIGLISSFVIATITNLILPFIANFYVFSPYGAFSTILFVSFTTYAIVRHKLMDIRLVVARSLAYILLLAALAGIYAISVLLLERLLFPQISTGFDLALGALRTSISVVMVFLFQPLKSWIMKVTDKIFFRNQYDPDELLSALSNTMGSTIVLIELLYKVGDLLSKNLKASRVLFALIRDDTRMYNVQAVGYKQTPDVDPRDVMKLTKDGIIHIDDLEDGSRMKHLLTEYQATLAIPLRTEKEIVGVILVGEKSSGDMYSQQDMSVLEILAPELSVAVENAKSYEEISRFNTTLRQEVKRATYRLKQKNDQLMELDHAKDEFISMASHQLRTPLTAIKGYLSMLLEGDAGDIKVSQYDFINEAYSGANRMVGLINDLLNVSRMDTGRFFLEAKEVDIERVVNEEIKQLSNSAKAKGLYLKLDAKGKVPHIYADETKIRQVIMNFMDNAIYYTNTGGVTVVLRHDKDNFIYEVHDTGIGVPKSQRDHMFEKFFRADNARTARPDGTGLGIYLAKRVVLDHGGEIIFDSTEGKGSVFGFKFPLKKMAAAKMASAPVPRPAGTVPSMPLATEIAAKNE
jgi:signal transduction histidine kinase